MPLENVQRPIMKYETVQKVVPKVDAHRKLQIVDEAKQNSDPKNDEQVIHPKSSILSD